MGPVPPSPVLGGTGHVRALLWGHQLSEQERGLGRAERERPQLVEHAVVSGNVCAAFPALPGGRSTRGRGLSRLPAVAFQPVFDIAVFASRQRIRPGQVHGTHVPEPGFSRSAGTRC